MVRVIVLVLALMITLVSCGVTDKQIDSNDSSQEYQFEYDDYSAIANKISELLRCDARTGASMESEINLAGISIIKDVNLVSDDNIYRILEILDSDDNKYYAHIGRGYFMEKIKAGSIDGEVISYNIQ